MRGSTTWPDGAGRLAHLARETTRPLVTDFRNSPPRTTGA